MTQPALRIITRSAYIQNPLFSDVVEYISALNDTYEITRFISDSIYDEARERIRRHISGGYENLLQKLRRAPTPEETGDRYRAHLAAWQSAISQDVYDYMQGDSLDLNNIFFLDEVYLKAQFRLDEAHKLRINRIYLNSPLEIAAIVAAIPAAITALWGLVQIYDKLANLKKLKLEIQKLQRELAGATHYPEKIDSEDSNRFTEKFKEATPYEKAIYRREAVRIREAIIRIREIDIDIIESDDKS
jgi:hypothetical protein